MATTTVLDWPVNQSLHLNPAGLHFLFVTEVGSNCWPLGENEINE